MLLAGALILFVCMFLFGVPWRAFFLLVPASLITFVLSLIIGHFLAEPLQALVRKVQIYRNGGEVSFSADGRLYEADSIAITLDSLIKKVQSQQSDLIRESRRQNEFVSDVAHELRTPLTAIRGNAELLDDPDLPPEMHEKFCGIIVSESESSMSYEK